MLNHENAKLYLYLNVCYISNALLTCYIVGSDISNPIYILFIILLSILFSGISVSILSVKDKECSCSTKEMYDPKDDADVINNSANSFERTSKHN